MNLNPFLYRSEGWSARTNVKTWMDGGVLRMLKFYCTMNGDSLRSSVTIVDSAAGYLFSRAESRSQESAGNRVTRDTRDNNRTYAGQWSIFSSGQSRWRRTMAPSSARLSLRNSNYARLPRRIASAVGSTRFLRAIIFWQTMLFHYTAWNSFSYRRSIGRRYQIRETLDTLGVTCKLRSNW